MVTPYTSIYQPNQKFNNTIIWEEFRTLKSWDEVITQFQHRIDNFFSHPIKLLYKRSLFGKKLSYVHNFPISNICWSLLDLIAQLIIGSDVTGKKIDKFLSNKHFFFKNINEAINLANSYKQKGDQYVHTVYDIFRNKPTHNAMVKGLGSLDHLSSDVFTISPYNIVIDGTSSKIDIIIENPVALFKAICLFFKTYISFLRKSRDLQKKFKKRIEDLFEFKFQHIK